MAPMRMYTGRGYTMTQAEVYDFLSKQKLGVLGTLGEKGPQAALMGIAVTPQLEIIFDTVKSSRKYPNLSARPACSFVIGGWGPMEQPGVEQTVQYEGYAEELKSPELERYQDIYFKTWTDGPARMSWPGIVYFVVRPAWVRYTEYGDGPPKIAEFNFTDWG